MKESAYSVKSVSMDALISCILGGISILALLIAVIASYRYNGNGPAAVGLLGVGSLILAICGVAFGVLSWKSQDGGLLMKRIAVIMNAVPLLVAVVFFVTGLIL